MKNHIYPWIQVIIRNTRASSQHATRSKAQISRNLKGCRDADNACSCIPARRQPGKMQDVEALVTDYVTRCGAWADVEAKAFASEARLLDAVSAISKRTRPVVCLLDSGGRQLSSEKFAAQIERWRDSGQQNLFFCVGPADGWSGVAKERADLCCPWGR